MATQRLDFPSKRLIETFACQDVALCLDEVWEGRTQTGSKIIKATIDNSGHRTLSITGFHNVRGVEQHQYPLLVDDAQFLNDPDTGAPWILTCSDIVEIFPYGCIADDIIPAVV